MRYLDSGNYIGMDIVDDFYSEGLTRLQAKLVSEKNPHLCVISNANIDLVKSKNPDFVISTAVFLHVPPDEVDKFLGRVTSLAEPATKIFVGHHGGLWTRQRGSGVRMWLHSRRSIRKALSRLGYGVRFLPKGKRPLPGKCFEILPASPGPGGTIQGSSQG